jgi:hypothetical protein
MAASTVRFPGVLLARMAVLGAMSSIVCRAQQSQFKLAATARENATADLDLGILPDFQLLVDVFEPIIPSRCSWTRSEVGASVLAGGITMRVRSAELAAQLSDELARERAGHEENRGNNGGRALLLAVFAQLTGERAKAERLRAVAEAQFQQRLFPNLIVAGFYVFVRVCLPVRVTITKAGLGDGRKRVII